MQPACDALNYATSRSAISTANAWSFMCARARAGVTRPVDPEAAGHPARVLALDEAEDISVSRHRQQLAGRRAHHREDCLEGRGGGRETCWGEQACVSSHAASLCRI